MATNNGLNTPFPVSLAKGGTNAALVADNGGIIYSTASGLAILASTSTSGQPLLSGASGAPGWSTTTYPAVAGTTGKILISNGTNIVSSTPTYPNAAGTAGHVITSDGTNFVSSPNAGGGVTIQRVSISSNAVATGTTNIPYDDTIPQQTEGDEYFSLAITPTSALNTLVLELFAFGAYSGSGDNISAALFQDATADALAASAVQNYAANGKFQLVFRHIMVAGTAGATTFKIRIGGTTSGTFTLNGSSSARVFGGVAASNFMITEYI